MDFPQLLDDIFSKRRSPAGTKRGRRRQEMTVRRDPDIAACLFFCTCIAFLIAPTYSRWCKVGRVMIHNE